MGRREGTEYEHTCVDICMTDERHMINLNEEKKYKNITFYITSYLASYITSYLTSYLSSYTVSYLASYLDLSSYITSYLASYITSYLESYITSFITSYRTFYIVSYMTFLKQSTAHQHKYNDTLVELLMSILHQSCIRCTALCFIDVI